jgi:tRNA pseudouridine38-40 synthase
MKMEDPAAPREKGDLATAQRNIRLTVAFDGTPYFGWQIQADRPTVQGTLAAAIQRITGERVNLIGSGRTDSGTHARGLVASFKTSSGIPPAAMLRALNSALPPQIRILAARRASSTFNARHKARRKIYRYQIYRGAVLPPHLAREHYHYPWPLDLAAMQSAVPRLVGEHDFAAFAAKGESGTGTVREIYRCEMKRRGLRLVLTVEGNGFLHHMVRNIVGTLLEVGRGHMNAAHIDTLFEKKDRTLAGPTAPAHGLILMKVIY